MVCLHVIHVHFALKSSGHQLVHVDVRAVKLQTAHAVLQVSVPAKTVRLQIENLHVTIVITCGDATLFGIVRVTENCGPAVGLNWLRVRGLKGYDGSFLARVPHAHTAVGTTCNELRCAKFRSLSTNTVNAVAHVSVGLHREFSDTFLDIVDVQHTFLVDGSNIADRDGRSFKSCTLDTISFLPLVNQVQFAFRIGRAHV